MKEIRNWPVWRKCQQEIDQFRKGLPLICNLRSPASRLPYSLSQTSAEWAVVDRATTRQSMRWSRTEGCLITAQRALCRPRRCAVVLCLGGELLQAMRDRHWSRLKKEIVEPFDPHSREFTLNAVVQLDLIRRAGKSSRLGATSKTVPRCQTPGSRHNVLGTWSAWDETHASRLHSCV